MSKKKLLKHHPIQLQSIEILELYVRLHEQVPPSISINQEDAKLLHGYKEFDEENSTINIAIKFEIGMGEECKTPFSMKVELAGLFHIDTEVFKKEHISHWAQNHSLYILLPYLREHVFGLTSRCGLPPIILPLLDVPTFTIDIPDNIQKEDQK
jgi:preprotein translocase subunit SecB